MKCRSNKLTKISRFANGLSWFIITIFIIEFIIDISTILDYPYELLRISQKRPVLHIAYSVFGEIAYLFIGFSNWLILKGISISLLVIGDIDQNTSQLKPKFISVETSKTRILSNPRLIMNHSKLLSKVAVVSIFLSFFTGIGPIYSLNEIMKSLFLGSQNLLDISWIITISLSIPVIVLQIVVYYYSFKSLGMVLLILFDIENNTRRYPA